MKTEFHYSLALTAVLALTSCAAAPEPAIDQATVAAKHASVRIKDSSTSRTITTLEPGDKVDILEQQGNWYRIRLGDIQGWMQESTVVTNTTKNRILTSVSASQGQVSQNTATLAIDGNLRIEPGRTTSIIRKLPSGTHVEVIERTTLPRDEKSGRFDVWLKIRPSPTEVGWVLSSLIQFDVPPEVSQYTEDYTYSAVKPLNQVQDSIAGPIKWYVVGERKPGMDPNLDYQGIRVFTWNNGKHRYETAFRLRGLRGVYPLEVGQDAGRPTFRIFELAEDGKAQIPRNFVMNGVVVSEIRQRTKD